GNLISGNNNGIALGGGSSSALVVGNQIGTDVGGAPLGNLLNGIIIQGATNNAIGFDLGTPNTIAFNGDGVFISSGDATLFNTTIFGNLVGVGVSGIGVLSAQDNTFIDSGGVAPNGIDFEVNLAAQPGPVNATVLQVSGSDQVTLSSPSPINTSPILVDNI